MLAPLFALLSAAAQCRAAALPAGADAAHRRTFRAMLRDSRRIDRYDWLILQESESHRLNPRLVKSIIAAESGFVPSARSPKGAEGLMQLLPPTADEMGVREELLWRPEENLHAGAKYLNRLYREAWRLFGLEGVSFRDGPAWAQRAVIAAYHGGPAMLRRRNWPKTTRLYVDEVMLYFRSPVTGLRVRPPPEEVAAL